MSRASLSDRASSGLLWTFFGTGGQSILNLLIVVVLARLLNPSDFGVVSAALVVIGFAQIFTLLGIGPAIVQMPDLSAHHVRVGFTTSVALGCAIGLAVFHAGPLIASFFRMPQLDDVVKVLAFTFPVAGAATVSQALLQRSLSFRGLAVISFTSFVLGYGLVSIVLALLGWGVWALVFGHLGQTLVHAALVIALRSDAAGIAFTKAAAMRLLVFGTGHSLARLANYTATQADNIVVGRGLGAEALGVYGRAYQFLMLPTNLIGAVLDRVLFPTMASIQDDIGRLSRAYLRAVGGVTLITMPTSAVVWVIAPELVQFVLGPQWADVTDPLRVLIVFLVFRTTYKVSDSLARATGAVYRQAWRQWVYAVAVVLGAWTGLTLGGATGVAFGVGLAITLNFVLMLHLSSTLTLVRWQQVGELLLRHLAVSAVVVVAAGASKWWLAHLGAAPIVILAAVSAMSLVAWFVLWNLVPSWFGPERSDVRALVLRLARRLPKPK